MLVCVYDIVCVRVSEYVCVCVSVGVSEWVGISCPAVFTYVLLSQAAVTAIGVTGQMHGCVCWRRGAARKCPRSLRCLPSCSARICVSLPARPCACVCAGQVCVGGRGHGLCVTVHLSVYVCVGAGAVVSPLVTWEDGRVDTAFLAGLRSRAARHPLVSLLRPGYGCATLAHLAANR